MKSSIFNFPIAGGNLARVTVLFNGGDAGIDRTSQGFSHEEQRGDLKGPSTGSQVRTPADENLTPGTLGTSRDHSPGHPRQGFLVLESTFETGN